MSKCCCLVIKFGDFVTKIFHLHAAIELIQFVFILVFVFFSIIIIICFFL